jgi:rod shape determining protein RodA
MATVATSPSRTARGAGASIRRDPAAPWRHVDLVLVLTVVAIAAFGLLMIHSATKSDAAGAGTFVEKQTMFCMIGFVGMLIAAVVDYRIIRDFAPVLYGGTILVLLAVKSPLGSTSKGTQAWFDLGPFQLQPSEFAKLALILTIAAYAAAHRGELDLRRLGIALGIAAPPMALIYLQPDLGTALVFVAVLMGMLLVAGARPKHLVALTLLGVIAVVAVIQLGVLKQYQLDRLGAFIKPNADTQRSAYNLNQSKIAIGSGGITGKGLGKGPQTNLSYVPEQHTDFIFTVVGEELGFFGSSLLLVLFGIVVWRTWRAAALSKDLFGTLVCVGVLSMLVFQVFENAGMTMGIMPITGIPLPLFSYGGSSVIATFVAIGLVLNVHMRRFS